MSKLRVIAGINIYLFFLLGRRESFWKKGFTGVKFLVKTRGKPTRPKDLQNGVWFLMYPYDQCAMFFPPTWMNLLSNRGKISHIKRLFGTKYDLRSCNFVYSFNVTCLLPFVFVNNLKLLVFVKQWHFWLFQCFRCSSLPCLLSEKKCTKFVVIDWLNIWTWYPNFLNVYPNFNCRRSQIISWWNMYKYA